MKLTYRLNLYVALICILILLNIPGYVAAQSQKAPSAYDFPQNIDPSAKYLFYIPSIIVEVYGPQAKHPRHPEWGPHGYHGILKAFEDQGFIVVSEERSRGRIKAGSKIPPKEFTRQVETLLPDSKQIAGQVEALMAAGVPSENITVSGFSRGGTITLAVATLLKNPKINFVVLAGCCGRHPNSVISSYYNKSILPLMPDLQGRVLSIYDIGDDQCRTCEKEFGMAAPQTINAREIKVDSGFGHGLFWVVREQWFDAMVSWINYSLP